MTLGKTILCGTALSAIALATVPAAAQVTIGGDTIEVVADTAKTGGDVDTNGSVILDSAGNLTLDDSVDVVVVDKVLANLPFSTASVQHPGELDYRGRAIDGKPAENMHREGEIGLRLGRQHTRRRESRIVDQQRVGVAFPVD